MFSGDQWQEMGNNKPSGNNLQSDNIKQFRKILMQKKKYKVLCQPYHSIKPKYKAPLKLNFLSFNQVFFAHGEFMWISEFLVQGCRWHHMNCHK